ncbi:hypothetical protein FM109_10130 [Vibrio casei]|nr:hypothetical protein FM109_10130 [Vibrio casei]
MFESPLVVMPYGFACTHGWFVAKHNDGGWNSVIKSLHAEQ